MPVARVVIPQELAWRVFTKGIDRREALAHSSLEGDRNLGGAFSISLPSWARRAPGIVPAVQSNPDHAKKLTPPFESDEFDGDSDELSASSTTSEASSSSPRSVCWLAPFYPSSPKRPEGSSAKGGCTSRSSRVTVADSTPRIPGIGLSPITFSPFISHRQNMAELQAACRRQVQLRPVATAKLIYGNTSPDQAVAVRGHRLPGDPMGSEAGRPATTDTRTLCSHPTGRAAASGARSDR